MFSVDLDSQLMSSNDSDDSAPLTASAECAGQSSSELLTSGTCQLVDRRLSECEGTAAAAAVSVDSAAVVTDNDSVRLPADTAIADAAAHDADVHDEPAPAAAAAVAPDEPQPAAAAEVVEPVGNIIPPPLAVLAPQGLGDVHQAMMQGGAPVGFQPYRHPTLFALRV